MPKSDLVPTARTPSPTVFITCANPYKLNRLIHRELRREAIVVRSDMAEVEPGLWGVWVTQLRRPRRPWVRPALATTVVAAGVAGCWWLSAVAVSAVAGALAGVSLGGVLLALALTYLAVRASSSRGGAGQCRVDVSVTHRR